MGCLTGAEDGIGSGGAVTGSIGEHIITSSPVEDIGSESPIEAVVAVIAAEAGV